MKLSQLNVAIRDHEGLVKLRLDIVGKEGTFELTKRSLLAFLKDNFERGEETGLFINEQGNLSREPS